jgi:predicted nucleic acid-binding protein
VTIGYLLDANHLGEAITRISRVRERLAQAKLAGARLGTCVPVLCEIEVGIRQVRWPTEYRRNLNRLLSQVRIWPIDQQTAEIYGELYHLLRRKGRSLSSIDIMLAALTQQMGLRLLTTDRDFEALAHLQTENWLSL